MPVEEIDQTWFQEEDQEPMLTFILILAFTEICLIRVERYRGESKVGKWMMMLILKFLSQNPQIMIH